MTLLQTAIAEQDGELPMYRVRKTNIADSEADLTLQISSFYLKHLKRHGKKPQEIEKIAVQGRTLSSLVSELGLSQIDLLQIDAEGFDAKVVRMALKMPVRIDCINFEHKHLRKADRLPLFELLKANDYLLGYDAWNVLAVRDRAKDRLISSVETSV